MNLGNQNDDNDNPTVISGNCFFSKFKANEGNKNNQFIIHRKSNLQKLVKSISVSTQSETNLNNFANQLCKPPEILTPNANNHSLKLSFDSNRLFNNKILVKKLNLNPQNKKSFNQNNIYSNYIYKSKPIIHYPILTKKEDYLKTKFIANSSSLNENDMKEKGIDRKKINFNENPSVYKNENVYQLKKKNYEENYGISDIQNDLDFGYSPIKIMSKRSCLLLPKGLKEYNSMDSFTNNYSSSLNSITNSNSNSSLVRHKIGLHLNSDLQLTKNFGYHDKETKNKLVLRIMNYSPKSSKKTSIQSSIEYLPSIK